MIDLSYIKSENYERLFSSVMLILESNPKLGIQIGEDNYSGAHNTTLITNNMNCTNNSALDSFYFKIIKRKKTFKSYYSFLLSWKKNNYDRLYLEIKDKKYRTNIIKIFNELIRMIEQQKTDEANQKVESVLVSIESSIDKSLTRNIKIEEVLDKEEIKK